jgi:hypothetical protein
MSRKEWVPVATRRIIYKFATKQRTKARKDVAKDIKAELEKKGLRVPKHTTLLRKISEARSKAAGYLDGPWSIGCQRDPETAVPPEALPLIVRASLQSQLQYKFPLSIREAVWCGRIHSLAAHLSLPGMECDALLDMAEDYANAEEVYDAEDKESSFNTADLDADLLYVHHKKVAEDLGMSAEDFLLRMAAAGIPKPSYMR